MHSSERLLEIAVPTPLRRSFHYLPPDELPADTKPGCRFQVPFGSKSLIGILIGYTEESNTPLEKLRRAEKLLDPKPILPEAILKLCLWSADYYHHPVGDVLASAIPVLLRKGKPGQQVSHRLIATKKGMETDQSSLQRAPLQKAALTLLVRQMNGYDRKQLKAAGISSATIQALIRKGLVRRQEMTAPVTAFSLNKVNNENILLTSEQEVALNSIGDHGTWLIQGITGSGKTEIYLRAIEKILRKNFQALVLVPEIGLTPQTVQRFSNRFDVPVVLLHSGLTNQERLTAWRMASSGQAGIVIGTRSAVFTPLARPGMIVVDEEHDASLKQHDGFRYSARDLAVLRGQFEHIPVLLGSATPSLESLNNAWTGKYTSVQLRHRPVDIAKESYQIINLRNRETRDGFSKPLIRLIEQHLQSGSQVLVFLNRRGFAPVLHCPECHWTANCHRCDARMTFHLPGQRLLCHHCGNENPMPQYCEQCHAGNLLLLGIGTQKIEDRLKILFPGVRVLRIDRDSTRRKGSLNSMLAELASGGPLILVGTQMIAKGHHFSEVTLSVIVDIDSSFYSTDFKAMERMGQLILQVGGRSGRSGKAGHVVIQSHFPDQPVLKQLIREGYTQFAKNLLQERRDNNLPPFCHQALIRAESKSRTRALEFLEELSATERSSPRVDLLGPVPSTMEKREGFYRAQLLFSSTSRRILHAELDLRIKFAENSKLARKVRWSIDVDPVDLY